MDEKQRQRNQQSPNEHVCSPNQLVNRPQGADPEGQSGEETSGWDSIAEWTGGLTPESIEALREVRELQTVYPLLHTLLGRSVRDFLVRVAALKCIISFGPASLSSRDIDEVLYWLDPPSRESTIRALRSSGWLVYDPTLGHLLTDMGRWAYDVISFLHKHLEESELRPTVVSVEYALRIGVDPIWHLESLRSRLQALREEIEMARASYSEVVLRRAAAKLDDALKLSMQIRNVLDRVPLTHRSARRIAREIHDLLSRLHASSAELHAAITEVGRQYIRLTAGLTIEQIVRALMRKSRSELAEIGRQALFPSFISPPLLTTDIVASAAEEQVFRERHQSEKVLWEEPPEAPQVTENASIPEDTLTLITDLSEVARAKSAVPLDQFIPRRDHAESFLRASLLPLVGDRRTGEGVAGQLGSLLVEVESAGEGWPEPLEGRPISALTPGTIRPLKSSPVTEEDEHG
jgi:hypothetical protein